MKRFALRWPIARRQLDPEPAPASEPVVEHTSLIDVMRKATEHNMNVAREMVARQQAEATRPAQSPAEARQRKELEAANSVQPFEYASHVYVTVDGDLRWRCCGNLFTEDHSPWCASPGGIG